MSSDARSRAWFLGPKSENEEIVERLLLEAFRDYSYWRRNFHPEDSAWVRAEHRMDPGHQEFVQTLRDGLSEMLSQLKRSVPSFSPRYLGHMNTDLLAPGLLGYQAAMLYNQNNIVDEAAPITRQLEVEALELVAEMLGLPTASVWGHLCSGGTAANIESLWVARNLGLMPWFLALLASESELDPARRRAVADLEAPGCGRLGDRIEAGTLAGVSSAAAIELRAGLVELCRGDRELAHAAQSVSPGRMGLAGFTALARERLGEVFPNRFEILMSLNAHYSLRKTVGLLGLGEASIGWMPLTDRWRLDIDAVAERVERVEEEGGAVLAVVGVYGSTEEGAVDDLTGLADLRDELSASGRGDFWLHGDACYGGYALSMARPEATAAELHRYLAKLAEGAGKEAAEVAWGEARAEEWLRVAAGLGRSDSVSIDPHKLGYIPYPAGAVLYRDYRVRDVVRYDAPYLNVATEPLTESERPQWEVPNPGSFSLEGSRPGACAAALWLAHKTVPLDREGHGRIVAESILGARHLQRTLAQRLTGADDGVGCVFLADDPDLNILCYTFPSTVAGEPVPLALLNRAVDRLYDDLLPSESSPTQTRDFVIAKTDLGYAEYGPPLGRFLDSIAVPGRLYQPYELARGGNPWRDDCRLTVVRTVVMGPFLLHATTRKRLRGQPRDLAGEYAAFVAARMRELLDELHGSPLPPERRPTLAEPVVVLDDGDQARRDFAAQLSGESFRPAADPETLVATASTVEEALDAARRLEPVAAVVDVDLGPGSDAERFLEAMVESPRFRGAVVLAGEGDGAAVRRIRGLAAAREDLTIECRPKPRRLTGGFQPAINAVMEGLWRVLAAGRPPSGREISRSA